MREPRQVERLVRCGHAENALARVRDSAGSPAVAHRRAHSNSIFARNAERRDASCWSTMRPQISTGTSAIAQHITGEFREQRIRIRREIAPLIIGADGEARRTCARVGARRSHSPSSTRTRRDSSPTFPIRRKRRNDPESAPRRNRGMAVRIRRSDTMRNLRHRDASCCTAPRAK